MPAEVGERIVGRFAACLSERLSEPPADAVAGGTADPGGASDVADTTDVASPPREEPLNLLRTAGLPVAERAAAAPAAAVVVAVLAVRTRRRRRTWKKGV